MTSQSASSKMAPADAAINFRFKNAKETDIQKFAFSGSSVSVRDLKSYISSKHKLDQRSSRPDKSQAPSELSIEDLATGQVYVSDDAEIPTGATVIVARRLAGGESSDDVIASTESASDEVAAAVSQTSLSRPPGAKKAIQRSGSDLNDGYFYLNAETSAAGGAIGTGGVSDPKWEKLGFPGVVTTSTNLTELDWPDEKKIDAMKYQCLLFFDHTVFVRVPRTSQGPYCTKCRTKGHSVQNCTANPEYNQVGGGVMNRRNGGVRAPTVLATTVTNNPAAYASVPVDSGEYEDIPADLRCGSCQNLIRDALKMPCCDKSFCDSCIQRLLISDAGSFCPNCKSEVQFDQCAPDSLLRDSVEKWEREMQVKRQKRKEEISSKANLDVVKKEPTSSPVSSQGPSPHHGGASRNNLVYNRQPTGNSVRSDGQNQYIRNRPTEHHGDSDKLSSEPMRIGSVLGRAVPPVNASMFQQQEASRLRSAGFPVNNSGLYMANAQQRPRGELRAAPGPMNFFQPRFADFSNYMTAGFGMDPSAFAMHSRMPNAYMAGLRGFPPFMNVGGAQSVEMFKAQQQQQMRSMAAAQAQQQQSGVGGSSLPGPNLRITRTPNQPKVPVQSPFDSDRRSPAEKPRTSDDYRDKDRRSDKDDERSSRRDERKYDDRDRGRSGEKRRGSHDDRRSPERRRGSSPRDRKRGRLDSPERRDQKKDSSSRAETSKPVDRDRPRREEITPPSKSVPTRLSEKERDLRDVRSDKPDRPRLREVDIKEEVKEPIEPLKKKTKVESPDSTSPVIPEVKKESPVSIPLKDSGSLKLVLDSGTPKVERQVSLAAPKKEAPPARAPIKAPSPAPVVSMVKASPKPAVSDLGDGSDLSDTVPKDRAGDSKKEKSSKKDKDKSSRSSRKDRKPSKSSREKRVRSESSDKRSTKRRSDKKKSAPPVDDGVFLEHLQSADPVEEANENREGRTTVEKREKTHKSRSSRKDKESGSVSRSKRSPTPLRDSSKKRESRKNSEEESGKLPEKERERKKDRTKSEKSEKKEKSSHKSKSHKSSKSSHEKADVAEDIPKKEKASSSSKRDKKEETKIVDARAVLDEQRARRDSPSGRASGKEPGSGDQQERRRSLRKSDHEENSDEDAAAAGRTDKSSSGRTHKSGKSSRRDKPKSSKEKHSSRSSPSEKRRHKKKHRRDKREGGQVKSPDGNEDSRPEDGSA